MKSPPAAVAGVNTGGRDAASAAVTGVVWKYELTTMRPSATPSPRAAPVPPRGVDDEIAAGRAAVGVIDAGRGCRRRPSPASEDVKRHNEAAVGQRRHHCWLKIDSLAGGVDDEMGGRSWVGGG